MLLPSLQVAQGSICAAFLGVNKNVGRTESKISRKRSGANQHGKYGKENVRIKIIKLFLL